MFLWIRARNHDIAETIADIEIDFVGETHRNTGGQAIGNAAIIARRRLINPAIANTGTDTALVLS